MSFGGHWRYWKVPNTFGRFELGCGGFRCCDWKVPELCERFEPGYGGRRRLGRFQGIFGRFEESSVAEFPPRAVQLGKVVWRVPELGSKGIAMGCHLAVADTT